jgi:hypothetical protein
MRRIATNLEAEWGTRPFIIIACIGGTDEHIQFYHPSYLSMPAFIIDPKGVFEEHPDNPLSPRNQRIAESQN